jgi:hypothetical protein
MSHVPALRHVKNSSGILVKFRPAGKIGGYFPPSLVEVSRICMMRGASGDECGNLLRQEYNRPVKAGVLKKPQEATLTLKPALIGSYNMAVRARPVLRVQPGYYTVYNTWHDKMPTKCTERIQDGCPQQH